MSARPPRAIPEIIEEHDELVRRARDAATRLRRASRRIDSFRRSDPTRVLASIEARTLLASALDSAEVLAYCVEDEADDYDLAELERAATVVRGILRRRRLAIKLGETSGRTPEEAAMFEAKAQELAS